MQRRQSSACLYVAYNFKCFMQAETHTQSCAVQNCDISAMVYDRNVFNRVQQWRGVVVASLV